MVKVKSRQVTGEIQVAVALNLWQQQQTLKGL
jgi:hypothetical protein